MKLIIRILSIIILIIVIATRRLGNGRSHTKFQPRLPYFSPNCLSNEKQIKQPKD